MKIRPNIVKLDIGDVYYYPNSETDHNSYKIEGINIELNRVYVDFFDLNRPLDELIRFIQIGKVKLIKNKQ